MIWHWLSEADEERAEERAQILQLDIELAGRMNLYGARRNKSRDDEINDHRTGQRGEIAAARVYGVTSNFRPNTFHAFADIGASGEVRTRREQWHDLYVRDKDPGGRYYILVIGTHQRGTPLAVIGGIWDKCARRPEYRADHGGYGEAYFIPQADLEPVEKICSS